MENRQLKKLIAKNNLVFAQINDLYNKSKNISEFDSELIETFLAESESIDDMRVRFESNLDDINDLNLKQNPEVEPEYAALSSFDTLYNYVRRARNKITIGNSSNVMRTTAAINVTLPTISLPSFDGRSLEGWETFYQAFKANIHDNPQLSDAQRVQYLMGKLTHSALKLTAGIIPTGETYNIIWSNLISKYQDKRALGCHYLNNILDLKNCSPTANSLNMYIEKISSSIAALKQLNLLDLTDFILLQCSLRRLDPQTLHSFEASVRGIEIPTTEMFIKFIQDQIKILERSAPKCNIEKSKNHKSFISSSYNDPVRTERVNKPVSLSTCDLCSSSHHTQLYRCNEFKNMISPQARYDFIKSHKGCINCLSLSHTLKACQSKLTCNNCKKYHHTLLCFGNKRANRKSKSVPSPSNDYADMDRQVSRSQVHGIPSDAARPDYGRSQVQSQPVVQSYDHHDAASNTCLHSNRTIQQQNNTTATTLTHSSEIKSNSNILLSTAQIYAHSNKGERKIVRCLIDNGSQNNLITVNCCKLLKLPIIPLNNSYIRGIGLTARPIHGYVYLNIESRFSPNKYYIHALVVDCITDKLPAYFINSSNMNHIRNLPLADSNWNVPGVIDMVLGAQLFPYIYLGNRIDTGSLAPPAVETTFGYVLMGDVPEVSYTGIMKPQHDNFSVINDNNTSL